MKAFNVLLSVLVSLIVFLAVVELGLRLIGRGPKTTINVPDAEIGWVKRPNFEFRRRTSEFDVLLRTNALGLRDDPMDSPAKPAQSFRVLCLGDSFVLGYAVPREALFVDLLEHWWKAEGRAVDVVNAGTEAWSTDQEAAWLDSRGRAFEPDLVLCFPYENDIWWNGRRDYYGTSKPVYGPDGKLERGHVIVEKESWLARTALAQLFHKQPPEERIEAAGKKVRAEFAPLFLDPPPGLAEAETRTRAALQAMKDTCAAIGARLVLVPIPSHSAIEPAYAKTVFEPAYLEELDESYWSPDRPVDFFLQQARELSIDSIDSRGALRTAQRAGTRLYYQADFHLNASGNRELAVSVKRSLDDLGVFPAAYQAKTALPEPPAIAPAPARMPRWPWVFATLWLVLGLAYARAYRDEKPVLAFLQVGALLAAVFAIAMGGPRLLRLLPPRLASPMATLVVLGLLGFVLYKLGRRLGTILELIGTFTLRGHWYLMPLVMVLLSIGSLLVVAASSPLVAPFIYTLF
jgi:lysophospholipase L1-like esterase